MGRAGALVEVVKKSAAGKGTEGNEGNKERWKAEFPALRYLGCLLFQKCSGKDAARLGSW
jgi:hypothetical protein